MKLKPTGPMINTSVARPLAILFYHLPKAGGSSVMAWLRLRLRTSLSHVWGYGQAECFLSLHADVFPGASWSSRGGACGARGEPQPDWLHVAVASEFHDHSLGFFWRAVAPNLGRLRTKYASASGTLLTLLVLRRPEPHLLSMYRFWPPRRKVTRPPMRVRSSMTCAFAAVTRRPHLKAPHAQRKLKPRACSGSLLSS